MSPEELHIKTCSEAYLKRVLDSILEKMVMPWFKRKGVAVENILDKNGVIVVVGQRGYYASVCNLWFAKKITVTLANYNNLSEQEVLSFPIPDSEFEVNEND